MENKKIFKEIVENKFCIGCGICNYNQREDVRFDLKDDYQYFPKLKNDNDVNARNKLVTNISKLCPFSNFSKNEDEIANHLFPNTKKDKIIGNYINLFSGYAEDRFYSSGGGLLSAFIAYLFENKYIDAVLHVKPKNNCEKLFDYDFSENFEEYKEGRSSFYYPVTLANKINDIDKYKSIAVVGLPCFMKAINNLILSDDKLKNIIKYKIGIVCGHLKTKQFSEYLSYEILKKNLSNDSNLRFRLKNKTFKTSNNYAMGFINKEKEIIKSKNVKKIFGGDWGYGLFKLKGCDYCDDIFAETADVVFGDAWLDKFIGDWKGHNITISRSKKITEILKKLNKLKKISIKTMSLVNIKKTQDAAIRHRKEGTYYRVENLKTKKKWYPIKRVNKIFNFSSFDKEKYLTREKISEYTRDNYRYVKNIQMHKKIKKNFMSILLNNYMLLYKRNNYLFLPNWLFLTIKKIQIYLRTF